MTEHTSYQPTSVSPPGDSLAEMLEERGVSPAEFARSLDWPMSTVSQILSGTGTITLEAAEQLERALGAPADFWVARERAYREWRARQDTPRT